MESASLSRFALRDREAFRLWDDWAMREGSEGVVVQVRWESRVLLDLTPKQVRKQAQSFLPLITYDVKATRHLMIRKCGHVDLGVV